MWWFFVWIAFCIIAAVIASGKGRSGVGFFFLAFFLSPLVGIVAALVASPNVTKVEERQISSGDNKRCPHCSEIIKHSARVCKFCGKDIEKSLSSITQKRSFENFKGFDQEKSRTNLPLSSKQVEVYNNFLKSNGYQLNKEDHKWIIHLPNGAGKRFAWSDEDLVELIKEIEGYSDTRKQEIRKDDFLFCALCGGKTPESELNQHNDIKICSTCFEIKKKVESEV